MNIIHYSFVIVIFLSLQIQIINCDEGDFKVVTKIPKSHLLKYYSYSRVMILHFYIPLDTIEASFKFKARDDPTSIFATSCEPRNVSIFMKRGSYPVINPDGVPFPKSFLNISRPEIANLTIQTDLAVDYINFTSPVPGDWFAVAFVSWSDPNKDRIHQQGLSSDCEASLYAELSVREICDIATLSINTVTTLNIEPNKNNLYKFFVPEDIDHILLTVELITPCKTCENITIYALSGSVPNEEKYQDSLVFDGKQEIKEYMYLWPEEENWQYISIILSENKTHKNFAQLSVTLKYISGLEEEINTNVTDTRIKNYFKTAVKKQLTVKTNALQYNIPYKQYNLMRVTGNDNFIFEYDFRPNKNGSTPLLLNITSYEMTVLKFIVHEIIDIGGTLTIGLAIKPELKANLLKIGNFTVVSCIRVNAKEIPIYPNLCAFNETMKTAPIVLNSTKTGTLEYLHIPYPDPGTYYMSIRAFYDDTCVPCNCSEYCESQFKSCLLNCEINCTDTNCNCINSCEDSILEIDECVDCNCDGNCLKKQNETDTKNTSVIFSISSFPCISGKCGSRGRCNHHIAGGFIFSSCQCTGGYRGWDCSDGSQAKQDAEILLAILLLTLSNLLFIPSIFFAYRRGYYTEAIVYASSMIFSTFYHACDSKENQYGFCLFPLGVLQFCDFYCGLLNIWVTLVAMSYTNNRIISIAHVAGAIILAFSVTYNKHALWVFILPAVCGLLLIGVSWGLKCRNTKQIFPAKTYLKLYMPIGAGLVFMGLISYAFLETNENYKIVHSMWHVVMALSLIFLLPDKKTFVPKY